MTSAMSACAPPYDLVVAGGTLLTLSEAGTVVDDPVIAIRDGSIETVFPRFDNTSLPSARETLDAAGCLILPGFVNTHTHLPMTLFRGLADDLPLMTWLNDTIFPLERKYVDREFSYLGALLGIAEMLRSGTTTFCDGYFHPGSILRAARETGIRAVGGLGFFSKDPLSADAAELADVSAAVERFFGKWQTFSPLISTAVFPHSPYTCAPELLKRAKNLARETQVPFITHVAETQDECRILKERWGFTPVRYLDHLGLLDASTVAAHCNWVDDEEIGLLAERGVKVSHNPESNMKLAAGMAPVAAMLSRGIVVGLGTDGSASNNDLDMIGEMGSAARIHKLLAMDPTVLDAKTVLRMATIDGARVLGMDERIGSIEPGKAADLILIDTRKPRLRPLYNACSQLVYSATGDDVAVTIVNGRILFRDGQLTTIDETALLRDVETLAARISAHA